MFGALLMFPLAWYFGAIRAVIGCRHRAQHGLETCCRCGTGRLREVLLLPATLPWRNMQDEEAAARNAQQPSAPSAQRHSSQTIAPRTLRCAQREEVTLTSPRIPELSVLSAGVISPRLQGRQRAIALGFR